MVTNPAHALDGATAISLHFGHLWRAASDVRCSLE